jgi:hypothetical protein
LRRLRRVQQDYQPNGDRHHRDQHHRDWRRGAHRTDEVIDGSRSEMYYLSGAVYACLVGYAVCSFFGSLQYLWFVYYPLAYAVAIRRIRVGEQESTVPAADAPQTSGLLWQQYETRPALEQPAESGS